MKLDMSLNGRHAIVCGASSGIGRACALSFASMGATLTVVARREEKLLELIPLLERAGAPKSQWIAVDLDDGTAATDEIISKANQLAPVQILVNNSGGPAGGALLEADSTAFQTGFNRHVLASQRLVQGCVDSMVATEYGRIVNIISTSVREPIAGLGVSNTIRGAMAAWSKTLVRELPPGITINNVLPGFTDTERLDALRIAKAKKLGTTLEEVNKEWLSQVPEGRLAQAQEVAAAVAFLASPAASFIRGVNLAVDGGRMRSI